jgi:hypothetical protein
MQGIQSKPVSKAFPSTNDLFWSISKAISAQFQRLFQPILSQHFAGSISTYFTALCWVISTNFTVQFVLKTVRDERRIHWLQSQKFEFYNSVCFKKLFLPSKNPKFFLLLQSSTQNTAVFKAI